MRHISACLGLLVAACSRDPQAARHDKHVLAHKVQNPSPAFVVNARLFERSGSGRVLYHGLDAAPPVVDRGGMVTLTHYFTVERAARSDADVLVHGERPGAGGRVLNADHAPLFGRLPISWWKAGESWADRHRVRIPEDVPTSQLWLYVGLFAGGVRWTVETRPGNQDGRNRIRAARIALAGPAPGDDLPAVHVPRTPGPVFADGRLDEPAWDVAPVLELADPMGRDTPVRFPTKLRLLYDDHHLFVSFEATDADITERYANRDDPIYEHEAVELFLMPNVSAPALGPYVELQASPGGVIFDASFEGRRRGMNTGYHAGHTVGTQVVGTLNDEAPDVRWVSEWSVPFHRIRGLSHPPRAGDEWRMNAFRIEKYRENGKMHGEHSAWSPPRVGDFHHVARFGRMIFEP